MKKYKCEICNQEFENHLLLANHHRWKHKEKKEVVCEKCGRIFTDKSSYANHIKYCDGFGSGLDKRKDKRKSLGLICDKCGRVFSSGQALSQHKKFCDGNPIPPKKRRKYGTHVDHGNYLKGNKYNEIYGKEKSEIIGKKISKSLKGSNPWNSMSEETKLRFKKSLSDKIEKRYENGWDPKAGRAPKYKYKDFTVDGSWELEFCKWADENNVYYERNYDRFDYFFDNKWRKYRPDFKLDQNTYLEVKGYQTDKDDAKWAQFPYRLIVLKRSQINRIKKQSFLKEELENHILEGGQDGNAADC